MSDTGERTPLVIDSDGGIDDAAALFFAATAPDVDLVAVTVVHGNVAVEVAARNVCAVLEAAGRPDVPVVVGVAGAVGDAPELRPADFIHGTDGLGDAGRRPVHKRPDRDDAVEWLVECFAERPAELTLVTLGPLSNMASALRLDPDLAGRVRRLVVMGGAVQTHGNALPLSEANIAHDPVAAHEVVAAAWATPPLLVGLDVTHQATFTDTELALVAEQRNAAARFMGELLDVYRRHGGTFCADGEFPCHDLLATMASVRPLVDGPVLPMAVQATPGPAWGAVVVDRRVPFFERAGAASVQDAHGGFTLWQVGLEVDVAGFRREVRTLFGG